jgi:hypothetical protein
MLNSGQVTPLPKGTPPEDNPTDRDALEGLIQESSLPTLQPSPAPEHRLKAVAAPLCTRIQKPQEEYLLATTHWERSVVS